MTQYVRIKSLANTTYFFTCDPLDTIQILKEKILSIEKNLQEEDFKLYLRTRPLENKSTLHDQQVNNDTVVFMVRKNQQTGAYESLKDFMKMMGEDIPLGFQDEEEDGLHDLPV